TNAGGAYGTTVKKGRYTVGVEKGYCLRGGASKCKRSTSLEVKGTESVHFVRSDKRKTISGRVLQNPCTVLIAPGSCYNLFFANLSRAPGREILAMSVATGEVTTAVTNSRGEYSMKVEPGRYQVWAPNLFSESWKRDVNASGNRSDVDFCLTQVPYNKWLSESCDLVELRGRVVDFRGRGLADVALWTELGLSSGGNIDWFRGSRTDTRGRDGRFVSLFGFPGRTREIFVGDYFLTDFKVRFPQRDSTLDEPLKLRPGLEVKAAQSSIFAATDNLPDGRYELTIKGPPAANPSSNACKSKDVLPFVVPNDRPDDEIGPRALRGVKYRFEPVTNSGELTTFCPGKWQAVVEEDKAKRVRELDLRKKFNIASG
ncbi:MAG: carboxypeptidase-like regulatory domain-containing protein, partial [Candidatus Aminicenantales bacterium]